MPKKKASGHRSMPIKLNKINKLSKSKLIHSSRFSRLNLTVFALIFVAIGSYFLFFSHAAGLAGDINNDGTVNITDLSLLLSSYGASSSTCITNTSYTCDLNADGKVGIFDLSILLSNYGRSVSGNVAPTLSLNSSTNNISWASDSLATGFKGAISNGPRSDSNRTTTYQELGNVISWSPTSQCGQTLYYGVASEGPAGDQWSTNEVSIAWPACATKLRVSVNNTDGWGAPLDSGGYVSDLFTNIGVTWNRYAVDSPISSSSLSVINDAHSNNPLMRTLIMYEQGNDGNGDGLTPTQVTSDITKLIPLLNTYFATTGQPKELEFLNESYITLNAKQYATLYNAAHVLTQPAGIKLLAVSGTKVFNQQNGGSGSWFQDLASTLPGGVAEVDALTDHPYPAGGDSFTYVGGGLWPVWGNITTMHQESIDAGFSASLPWYFTETGSSMYNMNISEQQQASDITYMLNQITQNYPWVVYFNWYATFDDSESPWGTENWGLLTGANGTGSVTAPLKRPSFNALQTWMAQNASIVNG